MGGDKHHKENKSGANNQNGDIGDPSLSDSPQKFPIRQLFINKNSSVETLKFQQHSRAKRCEKDSTRREGRQHHGVYIMPSPSCPVTTGNFPARRHNKSVRAARFPSLLGHCAKASFQFHHNQRGKAEIYRHGQE